MRVASFFVALVVYEVSAQQCSREYQNMKACMKGVMDSIKPDAEQSMDQCMEQSNNPNIDACKESRAEFEKRHLAHDECKEKIEQDFASQFSTMQQNIDGCFQRFPATANTDTPPSPPSPPDCDSLSLSDPPLGRNGLPHRGPPPPFEGGSPPSFGPPPFFEDGAPPPRFGSRGPPLQGRGPGGRPPPFGGHDIGPDMGPLCRPESVEELQCFCRARNSIDMRSEIQQCENVLSDSCKPGFGPNVDRDLKRCISQEKFRWENATHNAMKECMSQAGFPPPSSPNVANQLPTQQNINRNNNQFNRGFQQYQNNRVNVRPAYANQQNRWANSGN